MDDLHSTIATTTSTSVASTLMGSSVHAPRAVLRFTTGALDGREFDLEDESIVGRRRGLAVSLPADQRRVSAEHAMLRRSPAGTWVLENLGAKRGLYLNGERVERGARPIVEGGDTITFGRGGPSAVLCLRSGEFRQQTLDKFALTLALAGPDSRRFRFERRPIVSIGRASDSDLRLDAREDLGVSRRHARIRYAGRRFVLEDLDSVSGTLLNGEKVSSAALAEGDVIELGVEGPRLVVEALEGTQGRRASEETVVAIVDDVTTKRSRGLLRWILGSALLTSVLGIGGWMSLDTEASKLEGEVETLRQKADEPPPLTDNETFRALAARYQPALLLVHTRFEIRVPSVLGDVPILEAESFGSGFLVSADGYAVTNRHVTQPWLGDAAWAADLKAAREEFGESKVEIVSTVSAWPAGTTMLDENGGLDLSRGFSEAGRGDLEVVGNPPLFLTTTEHEGTEVEIVASNHADLSLLRLHGYAVDPEAVPPLATARPAALDPVVSLGFPHGRKLLEGEVAAVSPTIGEVRKVEETLQLSIATYPGNSGGPVLSADGQVLGVTTRRYGEGLGVGIPADKVRALFDHLGVTI